MSYLQTGILGLLLVLPAQAVDEKVSPVCPSRLRKFAVRALIAVPLATWGLYELNNYLWRQAPTPEREAEVLVPSPPPVSEADFFIP